MESVNQQGQVRRLWKQANKTLKSGLDGGIGESRQGSFTLDESTKPAALDSLKMEMGRCQRKDRRSCKMKSINRCEGGLCEASNKTLSLRDPIYPREKRIYQAG